MILHIPAHTVHHLCWGGSSSSSVSCLCPITLLGPQFQSANVVFVGHYGNWAHNLIMLNIIRTTGSYKGTLGCVSRQQRLPAEYWRPGDKEEQLGTPSHFTPRPPVWTLTRARLGFKQIRRGSDCVQLTINNPHIMTSLALISVVMF